MIVIKCLLKSRAFSLVVGPALGWLNLRLMEHVQHVPTPIILQFVSTFGVWMLADGIGLSGVISGPSISLRKKFKAEHL
jgi:CPA1 family monovalent cation:H+ antiporter